MTLTKEEKQARAAARSEARKAAKRAEQIAQERAQKPVKEITITIEWKKSRTWGANPHCTANIHYWDGTWEQSPTFTASGCGYDKESTVIAEVFNYCLKYKLHRIRDKFKSEKFSPKHIPAALTGGRGSGDKGKLPYGISFWGEDKRNCDYAGGIGTSCYYAISEHIKGKFECITSGKSFDVYKYTDKDRRDSRRE